MVREMATVGRWSVRLPLLTDRQGNDGDGMAAGDSVVVAAVEGLDE